MSRFLYPSCRICGEPRKRWPGGHLAIFCAVHQTEYDRRKSREARERARAVVSSIPLCTGCGKNPRHVRASGVVEPRCVVCIREKKRVWNAARSAAKREAAQAQTGQEIVRAVGREVEGSQPETLRYEAPQPPSEQHPDQPAWATLISLTLFMDKARALLDTGAVEAIRASADVRGGITYDVAARKTVLRED